MEGRTIYVKHPSYNNTFVGRSDSLYHEGVSVSDGAPGRGSGRYPLGSGKRPFQRKDGTLGLLGKIAYRTTNKYKLMSDDEIQQYTRRKQLEKNASDLEKQTSTSARISSKLGQAAEDLAVSTVKRAAEKVINHYIDKGVAKVLKTDEASAKKAREELNKQINALSEGLSQKDKNRIANEIAADDKLRKSLGGDSLKDEDKIKFAKDLKTQAEQEKKPKSAPKSESKPEQKPEPNPEQKSEPKQESKPAPKPESKSESPSKSKDSGGVSSSDISKMKAMRARGESVEEIAEKTDHSTSTIAKYVNLKKPLMKKLKDPMDRPKYVDPDEPKFRHIRIDKRMTDRESPYKEEFEEAKKRKYK